nr:AMP deaminase-like [Tanacetum cinerariifolium]
MDAELKGRKDDDNAATKDASAAEPTVFDYKEVTMTMDQTLIKMKAKNARLFNEQMAKRLHDEEVKQAVAREKQEKVDLEKAKVLQQQKNMIIYLKNMDGYKMEHFRDMTYDKVRPIFKREYNKVQTLVKPDKVVEEPQKKRVAEETMLQGSFKKLKAVKVSGSHSTQDTPTHDPKEMSEKDVQNMLEIVPVFEFKRSSDENFHEGQSTKEQKFGYILQLIKKLELKKLDTLLAEVDVVQRLAEKALRDSCCWLMFLIWENRFSTSLHVLAFYCRIHTNQKIMSSEYLDVMSKLCESKGMNTIRFRPHCGEVGDIDHLAAAFLTTHNIAHGINLRKSHVLQYMYYLSISGVSVLEHECCDRILDGGASVDAQAT